MSKAEMRLQERILAEENEFPKLFSSYIEKDYGILFYNTDDPESNDSNHAVIYPEQIENFEAVIQEIKTFYLEKELMPLICQSAINGYFQSHKAILLQNRFTVKVYGKNNIMLLTDANTIKCEKRLNIRRITEWDERIGQLYRAAGEEYGIEVEKNSLRHNDYYLFIGYLGEEAVVTVSFHKPKYDVTRFNYILTAPKHRGQGYAREILSHVTDYCRANNFPNCFQWPAHASSERICYEAGFRTLFQYEGASASFEMKQGGM